MKMTELTEKELVEINGGAGTAKPFLGIGLKLGGDNLLTLSLETHNGDESQTTNLLVLNGLNILGKGQYQNV